MATATGAERPDLTEILGRVLRRVARERQPLLVAIAERLAAERYRGWAEEIGDADRAAGLRSCADREEEIAGRVEALYPDGAAIQTEIRSDNPDLGEINHSIFGGRPLEQQFSIQAQGERLGAATWRAFAADEADERIRNTFLACAGLEEANAAFLEAILRGGP